MSDSKQFIPAFLAATTDRSDSTDPEWCPPEETHDYALDITRDLLSGKRDRQEDGLRRLCIEALEKGSLTFQAAGEVDRMREKFGMFAALSELSLCLLFPDVWPPEWVPNVRVERKDPAETVQ